MYLNIFYERPTEELDYSPGHIHIFDSEFGYKKIPYVRYAYKLDLDGDCKTLYGQPCKKTRKWSKEAEDAGQIYEGDVTAEMRYLVDNYTEFDSIPKNHVEMFFDIEVDATNGLPDIKQAENKVTAIAYHIKGIKEYIALILDESKGIEDQEYETMQGEKVRVLSFETEQDLLERFMDDYIKIKPTILTGWNIDNFDIPYLYNRMSRIIGDLANQLSPIGLIHWNEMRQRYFIAGVSCLDYMQLYKKLRAGQRISYSLDSIGKLEVKMGKIKYEGTLDKLYREDKEKYIEYNIHDVRIVVAIDEKLKFIELTKGVCHKGHVPYEDIYYPSRYLDGAILTYMKIKNLVAPNRPKYVHHSENNDGDDDDDDNETFSGAYVKEPIPGKYKWVVDLDAQSLYPSIIMTLNISPETKIAKVEGWNSLDYKNNKPAQYTIDLVDKVLTLDNEKMHSFLKETGFTIASNGVMYNLKTPGIIPEILNRWFEERLEYKDLMKKFGKEKNKEKYEYYYMRQYIQKVILNSLYGVLGLPGFRFYDLDNAAAVTTTGVDLIKFTQKTINFFYWNELGGEQIDYVIYIDTDSCFFSVESIVKKRFPELDWTDTNAVSLAILSVTADIQTFVNNKMDYFAQSFLNSYHKHRFYLKQELIASAAFWTAKKRYALNIINKEGLPIEELEVKGLDVVRTSFPKVFKDFMIQMLKDILADVDKNIIDIKVTDLKSKLSSFTISDLARPTGVKNITKHWKGHSQPFHGTGKGAPAHVKAAINYNDFIRHYHLEKKYSLISNGEKIRWVYLKDINPLKLDGLAFRDNGEDPPEILEYINKYIDLEEVFKSELVKKLSDFYKALGWGNIPTNINPNSSKFF